MIEHALNAHEMGALVGSVAAAVDVGVVDLLLAGVSAESELCARSGCDPLALDRVLAVLAGAGLLHRNDGNVALSSSMLRDGAVAPGGLSAIVGHYAHTRAFLRSGQRLARMDGGTKERAGAYESAVGDLGHLFAESAATLASKLRVASHVLDVGAGSGVWSLAMASDSRAIDTRVTALDLTPVLPSFLARAHSLCLSERVATIAGDFHAAALQRAGFDRAVLANVLHLERAEKAAMLVARIARTIAPGGEMVVVDVFPLGPHGALSHAAYELHLAMRTGSARAHPAAMIERWMRDAGLEPVELHALPGRLSGMGALVARAAG